MGIDYTCICHDCKVYADMERYADDQREFIFRQFEGVHGGHRCELTTNYDELWDHTKDGWQDVRYVPGGWGAIERGSKGAPYESIPQDVWDNFVRVAVSRYPRRR